MTKQEALFHYLLRLADKNLILGHRLSEWCGHGPILEEDIAMTNMALDMLGQASAFYKYAGTVESKGRTEDDLVYKRGEREFFNPKLSELPSGDFAFTTTRLFLNDVYDFLLYEQLSKSSDAEITAIAAKSLKEVSYHLRHSTEWMKRLGDGTEESHQRAQEALDELWPFTNELFETNEADAILQKEGVAADQEKIKAAWDKQVTEVLKISTLKKPATGWMQTGRLDGKHTEHLGFILAEMQYLPRAYPDAKW